jgi:pimeloyl-ACP methyl ester carboxylesterase
VLTVADLPPGWSLQRVDTTKSPVSGSCFANFAKHPTGVTSSVSSFAQGSGPPTLVEVLATGPQARQMWRQLDRALAHCRRTTLILGGRSLKSTVRPLVFPKVGSSSSAYAWRFRIAGVEIGFDMVIFRAGAYDGYVAYADFGSPDVATVKAFVDAAVAKAETSATAPVPATVSVATAPVQTVHTTMGTVAYRDVGSGTPLVMITGYSGTMESWDRRFVDALARHHRVVIFDNAGVGQTQALPAPLTIDAMADQTSALIDALGLKRPNVLGWSMGSMIAQALAVRHPSRVRRLVLCASFPGDGTTVRPSRAELNAFESGDPKPVMAALFPADQSSAQNTYLAAVSSYPSAPAAPADVVAAQGKAVDEWWAGTDPAGRKAARISVPTLVADGTADPLDPVANSHALAALIPGARLQLYPDAAHAFLFQEQATFVPLLESFLR